jgi:hypothetical protein
MKRVGRVKLAAVRELDWRLWAGLGAGTLPSILLAIGSGHLTTNGMLVKSHFAIDMDWVRYMWETGRTIAAVPGRLLWSPHAVMQGLMMVAVVAGLAGLLWGARLRDSDGKKNGGLGVAVGACFVAAICFYGFLMEHIEHHNRYYMPFLPLVVFTMVVGLDTLSQPFPEKLRPWLRRTAVVVLAVVGFGSVGEWARIYAHNGGDISGHYLPMARWMRRNIPAGETVAVHDAGLLPYLGGHKCYDMIGLVTNDFRPPGGTRSDGFIWETLERLKPGYMVIYPNFFGMLSRLRVLRRLHSVRIPRVTIAGGREKVAFKIEWNRVGSADEPLAVPAAQAGWKVVDMLDPADVVNERRHDYRVDHGRFRHASRFALRRFGSGGRMIIDGARVYSDYESFTVRNLKAGRPLLVGVRSDFGQRVVLEVLISGKRHTFWELGSPNHRSRSEAYLLIPGDGVRRSRVRFTMRVAEPPRGGFASFHYFFLQQP